MAEQNSGLGGMHQTIQSMSRDALAVTFRHRRLIRRAFLWLLFGGIIAVMVFGISYESQAELAVRLWTRTPAAVTPDASPRPLPPNDNNVTEEAINSEIELLTSNDILQHVVVTCGLQYGEKKWFTPYKLAAYRAIPGYWDTLVPRAVSKLNDDLEIDEVKSSSMLNISYSAKDSDQASCVTRALLNFYMAKHQGTWRPPQMFDFFSQQSASYRKRLYGDEQKLIDFARTQDAVDAPVQMSLDVNQESQFLGTMRQTEAQIAGTQEQIRANKELEAALASRIPTNQTVSDNFQLVADLKTTLVNLEIQRTSLLNKYDPDYPLVKVIDNQIVQARKAIVEQGGEPVRENNTGPNPIYTQVQESLATAHAMLPDLQSKAASEAEAVKRYHDEALAYDQKAVQQADLQREITATQGNYLLYLTKREEARIEDMLDSRRVDNVIVVKQPTVPVIASFSPPLLVLLAVILAGILSVALAFVVDYLDPSFRTPEEVHEFLDVPVFASIPENGHEAAVGAIPRNGH